jgi:UBA-like domain
MHNNIMDTDKLQTFQSVCGTDENTATHVLASFGGDLDRAVNFFMENGEQGVATLQSFGPSDPQPASAPPAPIDLDEDDEGPIVVSSQSPDQQQAARDEAADQHGRNQGWLEEEAALQEALEASKVTAPGAQHTRASACYAWVKAVRGFTGQVC